MVINSLKPCVVFQNYSKQPLYLETIANEKELNKKIKALASAAYLYVNCSLPELLSTRRLKREKGLGER